MASRSQDLIQSAHQEITRQWWAERSRFDLFVSRVVVAEARRGDVRAAARRLAALRGIPRLASGREVLRLADSLLRSGTLPAKARIDALHVGVAAANGIDYLLTWNLRHLQTRPFVARSSRRFVRQEWFRRSSVRPKN